MNRFRPLASFSHILLFLLLSGCVEKKSGPKIAFGENGVVVSVNPLASKIGLDVLKKGGTAIDAAVAVGLGLGVVDQYNSGLGGGTIMVLRLADGSAFVIDGREKAPAKATRDMYKRDGEIDPELSTTGPLAVAVPGTVAAYLKALRLFGSQSMKSLAKPAIRLARYGFIIDDKYFSNFREERNGLFRDPESRKIYFKKDGSPYEVGDRIKQIDLARTIELLGEKEDDYFYHGEFANRMDRFMAESGGLITRGDMEAYEAIVREPVHGNFGDFEIVTAGSPTAGGIINILLLNMMEAAGMTEPKSHMYEESVFQITRMMGEAFKIRETYFGDSDFHAVPIRRLTSKSFADSLVKKIKGSELTELFSTDYESEGMHTTNFCVVDRWGNAVAVNQTVNLTYGAKITLPGTGVILNCEMDDFSVNPGEPNYFGLTGNEANAIEPGKRPLSSMTPLIVLKNGKPILLTGGSGGPRIATGVFQILCNRLIYKMNPYESVESPRFHYQYRPDVVFVEEGFLEKFQNILSEKRYEIEIVEAIANIHSIFWDEEKSGFVGIPDTRTRGAAFAY